MFLEGCLQLPMKAFNQPIWLRVIGCCTQTGRAEKSCNVTKKARLELASTVGHNLLGNSVH